MPSLLTGSVPGVLDPTQLERILAHSEAKLTFATFDTGVASGPRSDDHVPQATAPRIVIETTPDKPTLWRFVPPARREAGVLDEGKWPRIVLFAG